MPNGEIFTVRLQQKHPGDLRKSIRHIHDDKPEIHSDFRLKLNQILAEYFLDGSVL